MDLFHRIKTLCEAHKTSPTKVGIELGFSKDTINSWKTKSPSVDKIQKVADYFNVSTDYLLGRTDDPAFTIPEYQYFSEHELTEEEKKKVDEYVELLIKARK